MPAVYAQEKEAELADRKILSSEQDFFIRKKQKSIAYVLNPVLYY